MKKLINIIGCALLGHIWVKKTHVLKQRRHTKYRVGIHTNFTFEGRPYYTEEKQRVWECKYCLNKVVVKEGVIPNNRRRNIINNLFKFKSWSKLVKELWGK